ncbi:hypothetical protein MCOR34_011759 [Pyricularia oryzae]|nr:hypothetical protein MCOR34_011759 [Pyricularia oryzae]
MPNVFSSRRWTGIVIISVWVAFAFFFYAFVYVHNQENLISAIVRKLDKSGTKVQARPQRQKMLQAKNKDAAKIFQLTTLNQTLGLHSIQFLNLPHRHDRFDAAAIQSLLSDIDITRFPAVVDSDVKDQGLPPTSRPGELKKGEIGCWRAHANIWQYQMEKRIPALLILESDAAWDVNIRQQMSILNKPFRELLVQDNPDVFQQSNYMPAVAAAAGNRIRSHAKDFSADNNSSEAKRASLGNKYADPLPIDPEDPWAARTGLWDILTIGHCFDSRDKISTSFRVYDDPWGPKNGFKFNDIGMNKPLERQRVVFKAAGMVCTTGYIISLRGAAKLLIRTNLNLDMPVDLVMDEMAKTGELTI